MLDREKNAYIEQLETPRLPANFDADATAGSGAAAGPVAFSVESSVKSSARKLDRCMVVRDLAKTGEALKQPLPHLDKPNMLLVTFL